VQAKSAGEIIQKPRSENPQTEQNRAVSRNLARFAIVSGWRNGAEPPTMQTEQTELRTDSEIAERLGVPVSSVQIARFGAWRESLKIAQYRATPIDRDLSQENSCDAAESEE
jgi:hypothetical protein